MARAAFLATCILTATPSAAASRTQVDAMLGQALAGVQQHARAEVAKLADSPVALQPNEYLFLFDGGEGPWPLVCPEITRWWGKPDDAELKDLTCLKVTCLSSGPEPAYACPKAWTIEDPPRELPRVAVARSNHDRGNGDDVAGGEVQTSDLLDSPYGMQIEWGPWEEPAPSELPLGWGHECAFDQAHFLRLAAEEFRIGWPAIGSEKACMREVDHPAPGGECDRTKWTAYHWLYARNYMNLEDSWKSIQECASWEAQADKLKGRDVSEAQLKELVEGAKKKGKGFSSRRQCEYALENGEQPDCLTSVKFCENTRRTVFLAMYCNRLEANKQLKDKILWWLDHPKI